MEFWRARRAIAAVEFAIVIPLLVTLMLGSVETARLIIFSRKVTQVSNTIVEMLAQNQANNPNETVKMPSSVTYIDLHFAIDSTMVIFPQILDDAAWKGTSWKNDIAISIASVYFKPNPSTCTSNCTYTANVVWNSGPSKRACGVPLSAAPDTSAPSTTTLPADTFGPGSLIVVDIVFNYTPIFGSGVFGTIPLKQSAYLAPRNALPAATPYVRYDPIGGDDGIGAECPGY